MNSQQLLSVVLAGIIIALSIFSYVLCDIVEKKAYARGYNSGVFEGKQEVLEHIVSILYTNNTPIGSVKYKGVLVSFMCESLNISENELAELSPISYVRRGNTTPCNLIGATYYQWYENNESLNDTE